MTGLRRLTNGYRPSSAPAVFKPRRNISVKAVNEQRMRPEKARRERNIVFIAPFIADDDEFSMKERLILG
jgi:hypothetical protein